MLHEQLQSDAQFACMLFLTNTVTFKNVSKPICSLVPLVHSFYIHIVSSWSFLNVSTHLLCFYVYVFYLADRIR